MNVDNFIKKKISFGVTVRTNENSSLEEGRSASNRTRKVYNDRNSDRKIKSLRYNLNFIANDDNCSECNILVTSYTENNEQKTTTTAFC